jgi:hypothetical protein
MSPLPLFRSNLSWLAQHLSRVAAKSDTNLMTAANLGVCFGPTLLKPAEETVATIMDIKFCNEVVTLMIEHCATLFPDASGSEDRTSVPEVPVRASSTSLPVPLPLQVPVAAWPSTPDLARERPRARSHTATADETDARGASGQRPSLMKAHTQDDLMASLHMMNSLAADLPSSTVRRLQLSIVSFLTANLSLAAIRLDSCVWPSCADRGQLEAATSQALDGVSACHAPGHAPGGQHGGVAAARQSVSVVLLLGLGLVQPRP